MSGRTRIQTNIVNMIAFALVLIMLVISAGSILLIDYTKANIKETVEKTWRIQASRMLEDLRNQLLDDAQHGKVDLNDEYSLQEWARVRLSGVRVGGDTGDGFMVLLTSNEDGYDGKFMWDGSPDCSRPEFIEHGRWFKDEIISQIPSHQYLIEKNHPLKDKKILTYEDIEYLKENNPDIYDYFKSNKIILHNDPQLAEKMINQMRLGMDTKIDDNYKWLFDDSYELLQWVVIPPSYGIGLNQAPITVGGVQNKQYKKILIQLGVQTDEIMQPYDKIFDKLDILKQGIYLTTSIFAVAYILFLLWMMFVVYKCKKCNVKL